ncbi:MAG TPA: hypothetical protein PLG17_02430 [Thermodesulfobacteriota bacterium]|nr:hypothetical protein [Deltaproteobacteria bacterium]HNR12571.1 hypothetical protein [Thermodesulfobacteriota bacterium]HNU71494.1 hypothetical protein [Thermodesulfobacteriota bacterium]HQO77350.1 hypothetical protein [Thermodesulfobacteriota bacterium]
MERLLFELQHFCNPLHVYCRLVQWGIGKRMSLRLCVGYEMTVFRLVYVLTLPVLGVLRRSNRKEINKRLWRVQAEDTHEKKIV